MEAVFGWSHSCIQQWYADITALMATKMTRFHRGFLKERGEAWQEAEAIKWKIKHLDKGDFPSFINRINKINEDAVDGSQVIDSKTFIGSIGAVDGTYSIRPAIMTNTLRAHNEDITTDRNYSEYIKEHANKLLLIGSHGTCIQGTINLKRLWMHLKTRLLLLEF